MAARPTAAKLPVKFDAGLLKIREFIEPLAQLRSHTEIKLKQAKLRTHDLEFSLVEEPGVTFRAIITRRQDINEKLWARIDNMAKICGGTECCVFVIRGRISYADSRRDLQEFDKRLIAIEPGPVPAMPMRDMFEVVNSLVQMHLCYRKITDRLAGFDDNIHLAYRHLIEMAFPSCPIGDAMVSKLVEAYPTLDDLVDAAGQSAGRDRIKEIAGPEQGARFLALLDSGTM